MGTVTPRAGVVKGRRPGGPVAAPRPESRAPEQSPNGIRVITRYGMKLSSSGSGGMIGVSSAWAIHDEADMLVQANHPDHPIGTRVRAAQARSGG